MFKRIRDLAAGVGFLMALILLPTSIVMAEENSDVAYLLQFDVSEYIELTSYEQIEVSANKGDTEGIHNDIGEYLESRSDLKKELPQAFVDRNTEILKKQLQSYADQYKISLSEFMKFYDKEITENTCQDYIEDMGMTYCKKLAAFQAVADKEGIEVTDEELNKYLDAQAFLAGYGTVEEYKKVNAFDAEEIREVLLSQEVLKFLESKVVYEIPEKE